jgi:hypothetical protein
MSMCSYRTFSLFLPPDDHGSVHFVFDNDSGEDSATDRHISGEGALLVDVVTLASLNMWFDVNSMLA